MLFIRDQLFGKVIKLKNSKRKDRHTLIVKKWKESLDKRRNFKNLIRMRKLKILNF